MGDKKRVDWKGEVRKKVLELLETNPRWRFPSVRSLYYVLSDALGLIPATKKAYQRLDELIVLMRKEGEIPFGRFRNYRGLSSYTGNSSVDPKFLIENAFQSIINLPSKYELPLLYGQPHILELWIEKKGLMDTFVELAGRKYDIKVRCCEGYSPWEFVNLATEEIKDLAKERESDKLIVLYFGDLDPSGVDIGRTLQEQLLFFHGNVEFCRIAVTKEQVMKYNLPDMPESRETLEKIKRDPRRRKYVEQYGEIFCELDSFVSLRPDEFKATVEEAIEPFLDNEAFERRRRRELEIRAMLMDAINTHRKELEGMVRSILERMA